METEREGSLRYNIEEGRIGLLVIILTQIGEPRHQFSLVSFNLNPEPDYLCLQVKEGDMTYCSCLEEYLGKVSKYLRFAN